MRLVLTEIHDDQKTTRREFNPTTIKLGRDPVKNNLAFSRERWPSVSRSHAEIHFDQGRWFLSDVGSRYGTLLNGQRISNVTEITSGSSIQLGPEGPVLKVELIDDEPEASQSFPGTMIDVEAAKQQAALWAAQKPPPQPPLPQAQPAPPQPPVPSTAPVKAPP